NVPIPRLPRRVCSGAIGSLGGTKPLPSQQPTLRRGRLALSERVAGEKKRHGPNRRSSAENPCARRRARQGIGAMVGSRCVGPSCLSQIVRFSKPRLRQFEENVELDAHSRITSAVIQESNLRSCLKPPLKWAGGKRWLVPHLLEIWKS